MSDVFFGLAGVFAGGLVARDTYELLKKRRRIDPRGRGVFSAVFTAVMLMWEYAAYRRRTCF